MKDSFLSISFFEPRGYSYSRQPSVIINDAKKKSPPQSSILVKFAGMLAFDTSKIPKLRYDSVSVVQKYAFRPGAPGSTTVRVVFNTRVMIHTLLVIFLSLPHRRSPNSLDTIATEFELAEVGSLSKLHSHSRKPKATSEATELQNTWHMHMTFADGVFARVNSIPSVYSESCAPQNTGWGCGETCWGSCHPPEAHAQ